MIKCEETVLVHRFLIPHIPSTRYLHHCRVVVSQRCHTALPPSSALHWYKYQALCIRG